MLLQELKSISSGPKELREFGLVVGGGLIVLGAFLWHFHQFNFLPFAYIGTVLIFLGLTFKTLLWLPQKCWMGLGLCLGWIVGHVLLSLVFWLGVVPMSVAVRISKNKLLEEDMDKKATSYWNNRELSQCTQKSCEKQY